MSFEYEEEYQWLTNVCLNVTDACNLECKYCFVEQHPHFMSYDVALKAVHFLLENWEKKKNFTGRNEKINLTYFGGEPTLMWDEIIVPLTKYIRENNYPIGLNMTTNGTLLDRERINFLKEYKVPILLSIDGAPDTQNFNRPCRQNEKNSFDLVVKNIPDILEAFPNTVFRGTIFAPTAHNTFENYLFAEFMGFKNIFLIPDERHSWTKEEKELLKNEIDKIYSYIDYCFSIENRLPINYSLINNSFTHILKHDINSLNNENFKKELSRPVKRCGLGTGMGAISYDGSIYGCQEQVSKGTEGFFYIGNLNTGINKDLHSRLLSKYNSPNKQQGQNPDKCDTCTLKSLCQELSCPSSTYDLYENFHTVSEIKCDWFSWLFNNSAILMEKLVKENNLLFKDYLEQKCGFNRYFGKEEING